MYSLRQRLLATTLRAKICLQSHFICNPFLPGTAVWLRGHYNLVHGLRDSGAFGHPGKILPPPSLPHFIQYMDVFVYPLFSHNILSLSLLQYLSVLRTKQPFISLNPGYFNWCPAHSEQSIFIKPTLIEHLLYASTCPRLW